MTDAINPTERCAEEIRRMDAERKAGLALAVSLLALHVATQRPRRKSIGERLWDLI
jgi:hypothetical protein